MITHRLKATVGLMLGFILGHGGARAQTLVVNGDFESGNTGFTSNYTYEQPHSYLIPGGALDAGQYSVAASAYDVHPAWAGYPDHTTGWYGGRYFVANGSSDTSQVVWQSNSFAVGDASPTYRFEVYLSTSYPVSFDPNGVGGTNSPLLTFQIGDGTTWQDLGTTASFAALGNWSNAGQWLLSYVDQKLPAPGDYSIRLLNAQSASGGNDFGIDDIYFGVASGASSIGAHPVDANNVVQVQVSAVPEPSAAAWIAAVGAFVFAAFRRPGRLRP